MLPGPPEILTVTQDVALAHAVTLAAPEEWTEWSQSFGSALTAIGPETKLLVFDAAMDAPLSRLLPILFVDQQPGRRAIVIQAKDGRPMPMLDARITVLTWPVAFETLADTITACMPEQQVAAAAAA